jgi:hypothetical protein
VTDPRTHLLQPPHLPTVAAVLVRDNLLEFSSSMSVRLDDAYLHCDQVVVVTKEAEADHMTVDLHLLLLLRQHRRHHHQVVISHNRNQNSKITIKTVLKRQTQTRAICLQPSHQTKWTSLRVYYSTLLRSDL